MGEKTKTKILKVKINTYNIVKPSFIKVKLNVLKVF